MAVRQFQQLTFTPTAQTDQVLTGSWMALKGGSATDVIKFREIYEYGQAAASAINAMCLALSSTLAITPTALALPNSDGFLSRTSPAYSTGPTAFIAAATAPNRSPATTLPRLQCGFNAFGGIVRVQFGPDCEWVTLGSATTSASETVLSAQNTGTAGAMGAHITYEML